MKLVIHPGVESERREKIAAVLVEAVRRFAGGRLADDVTLLVLKNTRGRIHAAR